ncbi:LOW QUALITY PROTEIN: non-classical arabinogalactan protein 30 [Carica papaya]|uniref:LOW QUALITY PROTEIN: non-classical arabinogalactan protein 30 n=1 Tax=Carica papaya TaxID=3649 RepID=UPI000B8D1174|nr:LOW QUALITY PROTEIN: non-classical arabinogalactan protein 30 [Carica papaya]
MAGKNLNIVTLSVLLLSLFTATNSYVPGKAAEQKIDVVVEGMVYCQSCKYYGTWSLSEAKPIPYANISVICKNFRDQIYYKVFKTNENGYFYARLDGFKMIHYLLDHPLQSCHVKLLSSPLEDCSLLTNINNGLSGAPLRYEEKKQLGERIMSL